MPIYEYRCAACGFQNDYLQKISEPQLTDCPECGKSTFSKQITAAGFQLKGTGWYATDFKNNGSSKSSSKKKDGEGKAGESSKDGEGKASESSKAGESSAGGKSDSGGGTGSGGDSGAGSSGAAARGAGASACT